MIKDFFIPSGLMIALAIFFSSCSGSPESELIGTWKAQKVETDFDEQYTTPEMLRQVVEMQKETYFKITDDSTLIIISPGNTHETKWALNPDNKNITYFFDGSPNYLNSLGTVTDNKIVSESKTPLGIITIYYEKE